MSNFKTPMAGLKVEAARGSCGELSGYAAVRENADIGHQGADRIWMCGRVGEEYYIMARCRIVQVQDFCGGVEVSSMQVDIKHNTTGAWNQTPFSLENYDHAGWDSPEFLAVPDVTDYVGDISGEDTLLEYAYWSMAQSVVAYCRYSERNGLTCSDKYSGMSYRCCEEDGGRTAALLAMVDSLVTANPRLIHRRGTVGEANLYWGVHFQVSHQAMMDTTMEVVRFHNRNSGNEVGIYTVAGAHGSFDDDGEYQDGCEDQVYNEDEDEWEDCGECSSCEYDNTGAMPPTSRLTEQEARFYGDEELPLFKRGYWYNG
jgi:hypothetical protein